MFFNYKALEEAKKDGIEKFVVGAVISKDERLLILLRKPDDFLGGIYELPGGGVEKGETIKEGLEREVKEETSFNVKNVNKYLGHFDYISEKGKKSRQFNFDVDVFDSSNIKLTEHDDYKWIKKEELRNYDVSDLTKLVIQKVFAEIDKKKFD